MAEETGGVTLLKTRDLDEVWRIACMAVSIGISLFRCACCLAVVEISDTIAQIIVPRPSDKRHGRFKYFSITIGSLSYMII